MRRLSLGALFAVTFIGLACGPEVKLQEPVITPYDGEPAIGFVDTSTVPSTTALSATVATTTAAPTTNAPETTVPTTEKPDGGFVLDLGDIAGTSTTDTATTVTSTTEDFTLDLSQVTSAPRSSTTTSTLPDDASAFCKAAASAHAMVSGDNAGSASMTDYAAALSDVAAIAPPEVTEFYTDLASFTQSVADLSDDPDIADDADSLFARQPAASAFVEAECGFAIA